MREEGQGHADGNGNDSGNGNGKVKVLDKTLRRLGFEVLEFVRGAAASEGARTAGSGRA